MKERQRKEDWAEGDGDLTGDTSLTKLEPTWCGASEQVEPIKCALHLAWLIDTLTLFIHLRKSVTLGQSNSPQLN